MRFSISLTNTLTFISLTSTTCTAFQFPQFDFPTFNLINNDKTDDNKKAPQALSLEKELLNILTPSDVERVGESSGDRLSNNEDILNLVNQLESLPDTAKISSPAIAPEIYGRWRLLHTTNTDTSSPIQRKAVDATKYKIYQDIVVREKEDQQEEKELVVSQVVKFGSNFELKVDALGSTLAYPLPEALMVPRKTDGKILGMFNILGVSKIGEEASATDEESRISFVFDEGNFVYTRENGDDIQIPYPVPFRSPLFREAVKGWIDITYMSPNLRIARGNKGTTFVLMKEDE